MVSSWDSESARQDSGNQAELADDQVPANRLNHNVETASTRREAGRPSGEVRAERASGAEADLPEEKLKSALAGISDGLAIVDSEWRLTYVNDNVARMAGMQKAQMLGQNLWEMFPFLAGTNLFDDLHRAHQQQTPAHFEYFYAPGNRWSEHRVYPSEGGLLIFSLDITERKHGEATLREKEERLRFNLEAAHVGTWEWSIHTGEVRWSENMERIHGQAPGSFGGTFEGFLKGVHPEDRDRVMKTVTQTLESGGKYEIEYRQLGEGDSVRWMEGKGQVVFDDAHRPVRIMGVCMEITERKRREELLGFQASVLAQVKDVVFAIDGGLRVTYWNHAAELFYGFSADEVRGRTITEVIRYRWVKAEDEAACAKSLGANGFWQGEVIQTRKSGEEIHVETSVSVVKGAEPAGDIYLAIMRDITERKRAENELRQAHEELEKGVQERTAELSKTVAAFQAEAAERSQAERALKESEQRLHAILDSTPSVVFIKDPQGRYLYVNQKFQQQLPHVPQDQMIGKTTAELFPAGQAEAFNANDVKVVQSGIPLQFEEVVSIANGLYAGLVTKFPLRDTKGNIYAVCGIVTDITERKRAEKAVRDNEARLRALVESMDDIAFEIDEQGRYLNIWTADEKLLARPKKELIGQRLDSILDAKLAPLLLETFQRVLATGHAESVEYALNLPDGNRWFSGRVSPVRSQDGSYRSVCLLVRDTTERRQLEDALRESEVRFRTTFRDLDVGVAVVGRGTDALLFNNAAAELLGLTREQLTGLSAYDPLWKIIHEDGSPFSGDDHPSARAVATRAPVRNVVAGVHRPSVGDFRWLLCNAVPRLAADGNVAEVICTLSDITTQKKAEQAHRASEARLRALVESMDDIAFEIDENGAYLNIWTANRGLLPRPKEEMIGGHVGDFFGKDFARPFMGVFKRVLATGKAETVEYDLNFAEGKRWFLGRVSPIRSEEGIYKSVCLLVREVTTSRMAEEALKESEERFRLAVEGVKDYAIFMLDPLGHILTWNLGAQRIKGYRPDEIIGRHFSVFYPPQAIRSAEPEGALQIAAREGRFEQEGWRLRKDGSRFWADVVITAVRGEDGNLRGFSKVTRDVTERKVAEESLRELSGNLLHLQDEERRRMARELHDSTAQVLSALTLNLAVIDQVPQIREHSQAAKALAESMALADQAAREIRTFSYLLHPPLLDEAGLSHALRWYVDGFVQRTSIKVELEIPVEPDRLSRDQQMALFRIVQECLTNIHRHSATLKAEIRLVQGSNNITLEVRDHGKGLPHTGYEEHYDKPVTLGVGIRGMRERLRQLGGNLEIVPMNPGTLVRAVLPLSAGGAR